MSSHALHPADAFSRPTSRATKVTRTVVLLALIPVAILYLLPRVYGLVATPYRLDETIVHADRYNPALAGIAKTELVTLSAFDALDRMKKSLADVRATDAHVSSELAALIEQITGDLQATLDRAGSNVAGLVGSLDGLSGELASLRSPVHGAGSAVAADRATLARILAEAQATAKKVHDARVSADNSASNVSGS